MLELRDRRGYSTNNHVQTTYIPTILLRTKESPLRGAVSPKPSAANYDCLAEKRMFETELIDS